MTDSFNGKTILLVDDRPENLLTLEALLSPTELTLVRAYSGNEALKLMYRGGQANCILMDVQMPDMNGFETAALLQQIPHAALIPVVFITADDGQREVDAEYQKQLPEPIFMYKPIDRDNLIQLLARLLA
ncbi:MAG: response regulator [Sphingobacteriales bacterium]|nr:MAG: response regulator [Sphingobacteriales bacterium]